MITRNGFNRLGKSALDLGLERNSVMNKDNEEKEVKRYEKFQKKKLHGIV